MNTKHMAEELETDTHTLRRFLREKGQGVGSGKRYTLPDNKRSIGQLKKQFLSWHGGRIA